MLWTRPKGARSAHRVRLLQAAAAVRCLVAAAVAALLWLALAWAMGS